MWRATLKSLLAHKVRLLLTALAVVLGVAFVSGTLALGDTINRTFDELFSDTAAGSDLTIRGRSNVEGSAGVAAERPDVPEALLATVRAVEGVEKAEGSLAGVATLVDKQGKAIAPPGPPTIGATVDAENGLDVHPVRIREGRFPRGSGEVAVDAGTARRNDLRVGDRVKLLTQTAPREVEIVGIVSFGSADGLAGATLTILDVEAGQEMFGRPDVFDTIEIQLADGAAVEDVRQRVAALLPPQLEVVPATQVSEEASADIKEGLGFFTTFLLVFAVIALFVGAFIIYNTFTILVTQRTRELALLRALGASRGQVLRAVLAESAITGLVASVVGLGGGLLVAKGLPVMLRGFGIDLPDSETVVKGRTVVVALVVGTLVTVVSALFPAWRAAKVPPVAAMREEAWSPPVRSLRLRAIIGVTVLGLGIALLAAGLFGGGGSALELTGAGGFVVFLGVATLSPLIASPMARVVGAPVARMGVAGKLGRANAMRNPRRTASTAAALMIGLALVGAVSVLGSSVKASAGDIIDREFGADYIVSTSNFVGHSPELAARLRRQPGIEVAAIVRTNVFRAGDSDQFLTAMDPSTIRDVLVLDVRSGSLDSLARGEVMLQEDEAVKRGLRVGDELDVIFGRTGPAKLRVGGTYAENQLAGRFLVSLETFERHFSDRLAVVTVVKARDGVTAAESRAQIDAVAKDFENVTVRDRAEFKEEQERQVNQVLGLMVALLALAILIAVLGIVNTLALSVYERTRELGLLRAVGMGRRQVRRMVRLESLVIAVIGATIGIVVGIGLGLALVRALEDEGITSVVVPVGQLLTYVVLAGVAGVAAGVLPAWRASRLNVLAAISHN